MKKCVAVVALIAALIFTPISPASASTALSTCPSSASASNIGKTYAMPVPRLPAYLRCGTTSYGYRHIVARWTSDSNFDTKINKTLTYGTTTTAGSSITYRCNAFITACSGFTFKVVYETAQYSDGKAKGIITATDGS